MRSARPRRHIGIIGTALLLMLSGAPGTAATWRVPLDATDIQSGIDLSQPGDTLLIAPDTYHVYGLIMKSGVTLLGEAGPEQVVIDAQQQGMVIDFSDTGGDTRIANITFSGGKTTGTSLGEVRYPIECRNSTANFKSCIFRDNTSFSDGAGFYCADAAPILIDCEFIDNESISGSGGGFCGRRSQPVLINCVFRGNRAAGYGGGAFLTSTGSDPKLQKCIFEGNSAYFGGGVSGAVSRIVMVGCVVRDNSATDSGGGIHLQSGSSLEAHTSTIYANVAERGKTLWALPDTRIEFFCSDVDYLGIGGGCVPSYDYMGCLEVRSTEHSWGEIKSFYR